jgi:hypothetical protein
MDIRSAQKLARENKVAKGFSGHADQAIAVHAVTALWYCMYGGNPMTTRPEPAKQMAAAATTRTDEAKPTGRTAVRTKPIRITLDLKQADYDALNKWIIGAGAELGQPVSRLTLARSLRAMIHATTTDDGVGDVVLDLLRRGQD